MVQIIGNYFVGLGINEQFDTGARANAGAVGLDGHDRIMSGNASTNNIFEGGRGADNLFFYVGASGPASGSLYGGEGNDHLSGSSGQDRLYGGDGDDWMDGNWHTFDNDDDDVLYGGEGRDAMHGRGGDDVIYGGAGDDKGEIATASSTTWQDNLINFAAQAGLYGGDGNDYLDGGAGDDRLDGGNGMDLMSGGSGADEFVFSSALNKNTNVDRIRDFSKREGDKIVLTEAIFDAIGPTLSKKEFVVGKKAGDGNDYIIHDRKRGTLAYDEDGKGGAKAIVFATVEKGLKLSAGDFEIAV